MLKLNYGTILVFGDFPYFKATKILHGQNIIFKIHFKCNLIKSSQVIEIEWS